ncbi:MAG TPA: hypothetical protein VF281_03900 [Candidatus Saccharimonadales bacterium]
MQIRKHTKKINKPVLIITTTLLIGLVAFLIYTLVLKPQNNTTIDATKSGTTTSDQQQSENLVNNPDDKTKAPNTDAPAAPTTTPESDKKQVQMITSADQSNGTVYIRGGVNYPVTGGSCYAQLSGPSGQSVRKDSIVLPNPASTDCKTISIPASELTPGKWTFTLNYTSDEYEGVSNETSFTL